MNRQSNWLLLASVVVAATTLAGSCTPSNNPPPGPPVLTEAFIIENGASATKIMPDTTTCSTQVTGDACDPMADTICQDVPKGNWCRCGANMMAPPPGLWNCDPFALNSGVLYVFDRLLDTTPLGTGNGGVTGVADASWTPAPVNMLVAGADYGSNGSTGSILFPLLGTFRADGPSLFIAGQPDPAGRAANWSPWTGALPATAQVTFKLNKSAVLAKDGTSSFTTTSTSALLDGSVTFATSAFSVALVVPTPPPPPDPDAGTGPTTVPPDMTPAVATFTGPVDSTKLTPHVTVTAKPAGGAAAPLAFLIQDVDGVKMNIVAADATVSPPQPTTWPASSDITVTIDATTASVAGDQLGANAPMPGTFTTSAM
jgi:hypothetical protein